MKNNKGFTLIETLIVSTFVISTLTFLYIQFVNLKNSYDISFKYNTVPDLYKIKNVEKFLQTADLVSIKKGITNGYTELYSNNTCNNTYFNDDIGFCNVLMEKIDAKTVLFTKENLTEFKTYLKTNNQYTKGLYSYLKEIPIKDNSNFRILIEFNDGTYANLEMN